MQVYGFPVVGSYWFKPVSILVVNKQTKSANFKLQDAGSRQKKVEEIRTPNILRACVNGFATGWYTLSSRVYGVVRRVTNAHSFCALLAYSAQNYSTRINIRIIALKVLARDPSSRVLLLTSSKVWMNHSAHSIRTSL